MFLWSLRFKPGIGAVKEAFIQTKADDFARAEQVGKAWCDSKPGHRYIGIDRAVVADETILRLVEQEKPAPVGVRVGA